MFEGQRSPEMLTFPIIPLDKMEDKQPETTVALLIRSFSSQHKLPLSIEDIWR